MTESEQMQMKRKSTRTSQLYFSRMKELQEKHGLSTKAMAECLGCNQPSISQWETGRNVPKDLDSIIRKTAELFDLDPEVLLSEDFADRYDPDAYEKNYPEEKPKNLTPVIEINGRHYVNQHETDREIAIRYMTGLMEEQKRKRDELYVAYMTAAETFENYKNALDALGANTEEETDGTD